jgi:perosamine synthetase
MYSIQLEEPFPLARDELLASFASAEIEARTFFCPLNLQPFLQRLPGFRAGACPVAERMWETGLYLPSAITLTDDEIETVVGHIRALTPA